MMYIKRLLFFFVFILTSAGSAYGLPLHEYFEDQYVGHDHREIAPLIAKRITPELDLSQLTDRFTENIQSKYTQILKALTSPLNNCTDTFKAYKYVQALQVKGEFEDCFDFVGLCEQEQTHGAQGLDRILMVGAQCLKQSYNYDLAYKYYDRATSSSYANSAHFEKNLYLFAQFAEFTQYSQFTKSILSRKQNWFGFSPATVFNTIKWFSLGTVNSEEELEQVLAFETKVLGSKGQPLKQVLISNRISYLAYKKYEFKKALELIDKHIDGFETPRSWQSVAFRILYRKSPVDDFSLVRKLYDAYVVYLHKTSYFPMENNVFNYTQLYSDVCKDSLLQDEDFDAYQKISGQWLSGELSLDDSLAATLEMSERLGKKADLLTFIGSMYVMKQDDDLAQKYYWQAHNQCRYYNRAHRGLYNIRRRNKNRAYSDYEVLHAKYLERVLELNFSSELSNYVLNWNSLTGEAKARVKFSLRFWEGLMDDIYLAPQLCYEGNCWPRKNRLYIKPSYQLMSECPNKASQRDKRTNYDNRLRDDIRGQGGATVISEYDETIENPWGAYNLAGHEVAHQAHFSFPQNLQNCISKLYARALEVDKFPEAYAKRNDKEYFAQGVTYFMVTADSPTRFGLDRSWYEANDPDLLKFLYSIKWANSFSDIVCPIE